MSESLPEGMDDIPLGCRISRGINGVTSKYYMEVLLSETVILILTMVRGFQHRNLRSRWVSRLYRDGFLFYIYMLIVTVSNITMYLKIESLDHKESLANLQRVVHSICCNHVILDIQSGHDSTRSSTSLQFVGTREEELTMTQFFTTIGPEFHVSEADGDFYERTTPRREARVTPRA